MPDSAVKYVPRSDETDLVARLKQGDESAFRLIVETRKDLVYNTALGLLQNAGDAEDITQEVFIKVYESVHQFKGESAFSTWLYRIAVTKSLEMIRNRKRKKRFAFITGLFGESNELRHDPPDFVHPGVQLDNREKASVLFKAIEKLPENQRKRFLEAQRISNQQNGQKLFIIFLLPSFQAALPQSSTAPPFVTAQN